MDRCCKNKREDEKVKENRRSAHQKAVSKKGKPMTPKEGEDDDNPAF